MTAPVVNRQEPLVKRVVDFFLDAPVLQKAILHEMPKVGPVSGKDLSDKVHRRLGLRKGMSVEIFSQALRILEDLQFLTVIKSAHLGLPGNQYTMTTDGREAWALLDQLPGSYSNRSVWQSWTRTAWLPLFFIILAIGSLAVGWDMGVAICVLMCFGWLLLRKFFAMIAERERVLRVVVYYYSIDLLSARNLSEFEASDLVIKIQLDGFLMPSYHNVVRALEELVKGTILAKRMGKDFVGKNTAYYRRASQLAH